MIDRIAVLGLGKIGKLAGALLQGIGFTVTGVDQRDLAKPPPYPVLRVDISDPDALAGALADQQAVLSCLPYHMNISVAETAHGRGIHYFDLTEDVAVTTRVRALAETSTGIMAPQCGLAPGFIGIVGAHLAQRFDTVRSIKLRVGALPQNPVGLLGYAFNWSPEGVVNEYLNDCEVIEDGQRKWVSPMEWIEALYVNGTRLEAFTTSGGLGTLCETFQDRVENLDYKTMRYPGHAQLMNFFFHELLMRERRMEAGQILTHAKPPVDDDVVYIHASAEGLEDGRLQRREFVRAYYPRTLAKERRTAIAWTTTASVCAVIDLVRQGVLPQNGFLKQETVPFTAFCGTQTGQLFQKTGNS
ncbi:MAG: saccharopine dehydrogenase family protein [Magnetospiraceae bacterium]